MLLLQSRRLLKSFDNILVDQIKAPVESGAYLHSIILLVTCFSLILNFRTPIGFIDDLFFKNFKIQVTNQLGDLNSHKSLF